VVCRGWKPGFAEKLVAKGISGVRDFMKQRGMSIGHAPDCALAAEIG
jgi:hypothetical protein